MLPIHCDLLVRHCYLVTVDDHDTVISDGAIAITDGRIVAIGNDAEIAAAYDAPSDLDAKGGLTHPGLIDTHAHVTYHLYRSVFPSSVSEDDVFAEFTQAYMDNVSANEEALAASLAALEMVRNGITCFVEAGSAFYPDVVAANLQALGIRAFIADPFIMDLPDGYAQGEQLGGVKARISRGPRDFATAVDMLGQQLWRNDDPAGLLRGHIALRGLGTASERLIATASDVAQEHGTFVTMHQSYSPADYHADIEKFGRPPLEHLAERGLLNPTLLLSHVNHMSQAEADAAVSSGVGISWAPAASMIWGHQGALESRHAHMWALGANIALGSDSSNWSNSFDVLKQCHIGVLLARVASGNRDVLNSSDVLRMATISGARVLNMESRIGSLEVGKEADLVIHSADAMELAPRETVIANLVHGAGSKSVDTVLVQGRVLLRGAAFVDCDVPATMAEFQRAATTFFTRVGYEVRRDVPHRL